MNFQSRNALISRVISIVLVFAFGSAPVLAQAASAADVEQVEAIVKSYLLKNPTVIRDAMIQLQRQEATEARERSQAAVLALRAELLEAPNSPVAGNPKGDVTVVEFFDFQCGYCKQVAPAMKELLSSDPNIRVVYKQLPVLGPKSVFAAKVALAAAQQGKYAAVHDALLGATSLEEDAIFAQASSLGLDVARLRVDMFSNAIADEIEINSRLSAPLGITGTPAFVIGNTLVPGAIGLDGMRELVAKARKK